jgi:hypothetical protein
MYGEVVVCCEEGNKRSCSIKSAEYLDEIIKY